MRTSSTLRELAICGACWLVLLSRMHAQAKDDTSHDHMRASCVEVPAGQPRPEFGCFKIAVAKALQLSQPTVYWHLRTFPTRAAAEAVKSPTGIVVEEDGQVWLSEFGAKNEAPAAGKEVAVIGPLELLPAKTYEVEMIYAVLRPGDRSKVHIHDGPEAWYIFAGEQCLETINGVSRARAGQSMTAPPRVAMELSITG